MMSSKLPLLVAVVVALPCVAHATIVQPPSDDELVAGADVIALVTVERLELVISASRNVVTHAELRVERGVRGVADGDFIATEYSGGRLSNGISARVAGAPQLRVGNRLFVYLRAARNGALRPIGLRYGILNVQRHDDGVLRASRQVDGLSFVDKSGTAQPIERYTLLNVTVDSLIEDAQARMRRLHISAGRALNNVRGPGAAAVRR